MKITKRQLRSIVKEAIDIMNDETGELLLFDDDWETEGGHAPEAAAQDILRRLKITPQSSSTEHDVETLVVAPEDWAVIDQEIGGKRHYRKLKKDQERLDIDNLLTRLDSWAANAASDWESGNMGQGEDWNPDLQDVAWDLSDSAQFEFKEDEWDELIAHFDWNEEDLRTYVADSLVSSAG